MSGDPLLSSFGRLWTKALPSTQLIGNVRTPYRKDWKVDSEIGCWYINHLHGGLPRGHRRQDRLFKKHVSTEYCKINAFGL